MNSKYQSQSNRFITRIAGCLGLFLLCTSVLAASHVHDIDSNIGQNHFEHCAAYHVTDHQQSASAEYLAIEPVNLENPKFTETLLAGSRHTFLPPSRAPPFIS